MDSEEVFVLVTVASDDFLELWICVGLVEEVVELGDENEDEEAQHDV